MPNDHFERMGPQMLSFRPLTENLLFLKEKNNDSFPRVPGLRRGLSIGFAVLALLVSGLTAQAQRNFQFPSSVQVGGPASVQRVSVPLTVAGAV